MKKTLWRNFNPFRRYLIFLYSLMLFLFGGGGGEKYDTSDVSYFNRSNLVI